LGLGAASAFGGAGGQALTKRYGGY
jgi:hypothetical protein